MKPEPVKKQDVMTVSDSDDVQTISSGSEDNKEREKVTPGKWRRGEPPMLLYRPFKSLFNAFFSVSFSGVTKKQVAVKSTRGIALKNSHSMMVKTSTPGGGGGSAGQTGKSGQQGQTGGSGENTPKNTRLFFDGEESCYIIDAKLEGNLGRYLNVRNRLFNCCIWLTSLSFLMWCVLLLLSTLQHSCSPNLFVQNVFVDTHDLRFPWVAFFASKWVWAKSNLASIHKLWSKHIPFSFCIIETKSATTQYLGESVQLEMNATSSFRWTEKKMPDLDDMYTLFRVCIRDVSIMRHLHINHYSSALIIARKMGEFNN